MKGYVLFALLVMGLAVFVSSNADRWRVAAGRPTVEAPAVVAAAPAPALPVTSGLETTLSRQSNGHFNARANVNGQPVDFVVDTGATTVALSEDDARRLGIAFDPANFQVIGTGASGPVRGVRVTLADVELDGKHAGNVEAAVIEGLPLSLLGQSYLRTLNNVEISGGEMKLR